MWRRRSRALLAARQPMIIAGAGVLYAGASAELAELAEILRLPVMTTMGGKSAISEKRHPLALGSGSGVMSGTVHHFLKEADVVLAVGTSLTRHVLVTPIPPGKRIIQVTNEPSDLHKTQHVEFPILGDARLVLRQFLACRDALPRPRGPREEAVIGEIERVRASWLAGWMPKLTSDEVPINPYRVIWDFMHEIDPARAIVTHDSGNPASRPCRSMLRTGLAAISAGANPTNWARGWGWRWGAKLAAPEKFCAVIMGDAGFGMTGLDFETAARASLPICAIVLNNGTMSCETGHMALSHGKYRSRDLGGDYADIARALGGWSERVVDPAEVRPAIRRAKRATEEGRPALLEFITSEELALSYLHPFG